MKHGKKGTKIYETWQGMKARCFRKSMSNYKYYGGKGIGVSEDWLEFSNFYRDMGDIPKGKSLDRIDNLKGYSKENCKWSTLKEQNSNRKSVIKITYKGKENTLYDLWKKHAKKSGLHYSTMKRRLDKGLSIEDCLKKISHRGKKHNPILCIICKGTHKAKGYCMKHYKNLITIGHPLSKRDRMTILERNICKGKE